MTIMAADYVVPLVSSRSLGLLQRENSLPDFALARTALTSIKSDGSNRDKNECSSHRNCADLSRSTLK